MRKRKGNTQQIQRIAKYEEMMQEAERLINLHITSEESNAKLHSLIQELETYYSYEDALDMLEIWAVAQVNEQLVAQAYQSKIKR